jgi:uncharacterized membrane protein
MRRIIILSIVLLFLVGAFAPSMNAVAASTGDELEEAEAGPTFTDSRGVDIETEQIGGYTWTKYIRITRNSADDTMPQVVVDSAHNSHVVWQRSGYWTKTFDRSGQALSKEVFITSHVVRGYGSPDRYPLGPQVGIDSAGSIHVVWDDGWQNVYYQKFDADANALTSEIHIGNVDNTASHVPAVDVDQVNDYVHIVHEDYEYQCEDIVYDKLDNDGKTLVNEVAVSADVSSHCEHCTLTTDIYGYVHVGFGSSTGGWHRKVDQNGVARGQSVNIFSSPSYKLADPAVTPNGDVHLVWEDGGQIYYTRLDNNGSVLNQDVVISKGGVSPGPPRVAAAHEENAVYVVWHDSRDGNSEIYYAKPEKGKFGESPENYRLSRNPASSQYPRVAVDPDDNVHVVWGDTRDGNSEIYYKFMFNFKLELAPVDIAELSNMYFFHPNETKKLHLYLENQGGLADDYRVTLTYDEWAEADGWKFHIDETEFNRVQGNARVFFNVTMTSPALANAGDYINVSINASSLSSKFEDESLAWRSFIIVEKAVTVVCSQPTKLIDTGGTIAFNLNIANIGDVPDTYRIDSTLIPENAGWDVEIDKTIAILDVDESTNFTVKLSAPEDAKANENGTVFIRVQSMSDASVWDGKKLLGIINPTFRLELETLVPNKWVDPGSSVDFLITIRNVGNMQGKVSIFVTSTNPRPGWGALLDRETIQLAGGEQQVISLTVAAPGDALAGSRQVVKVTAVSEDYSSRGDVQVSALVNRVYGLIPLVVEPEIPVHAGENAKYLVTVTNEGNGNENVALNSARVPPGWIVSFELDDVEIRNLVLLSKETKTFTAIVSTPFDALSGRTPLEIVLLDESGKDYVIPIFTKIHQKYGVDLSSSKYQGEGAPKGIVNYRLTIKNDGNGQDTFSLEHGGLPSSAWVGGFYDMQGLPISTVILGAAESKDVEFRVHIPEGASSTDPVDFFARATSTSAETDDVKLTMDVKLPDLKIQSVEYNPAKPEALTPVQITVRVTNDGTYAAENINVILSEGDKEIGREVLRTITRNSNATASFTWVPTPGTHKLTFEITNDIPESQYDNNVLTHKKSVEDTDGLPGIGTGFVLLAILGIALLGRLRRRS